MGYVKGQPALKDMEPFIDRGFLVTGIGESSYIMLNHHSDAVQALKKIPPEDGADLYMQQMFFDEKTMKLQGRAKGVRINDIDTTPPEEAPPGQVSMFAIPVHVPKERVIGGDEKKLFFPKLLRTGNIIDNDDGRAFTIALRELVAHPPKPLPVPEPKSRDAIKPEALKKPSIKPKSVTQVPRPVRKGPGMKSIVQQTDRDRLEALGNAAANGLVVTGFSDDHAVMIYVDNFDDARRVAMAVEVIGREGAIVRVNQEFFNDSMKHTRPAVNLTNDTKPPTHQQPEPTVEGEHAVFFIRATMKHREAEKVFEKTGRRHFLLRQTDGHPLDIAFEKFVRGDDRGRSRY